MTSIKLIIAILLFSHITILITAQSPSDEWKIVEYGISDGLPNADVIAMAKTQNGELVVGHNIGISVFDGERFETVNEKNDEIVGSVRCIESYDEDVWVGSDRGLFLLRESQLTKIALPSSLEVPIFSFYILKKNTLILGTNSGIFNVTYNANNKLEIVDKLNISIKENERAYSFDVNSDQTVLAVGTTNSVFICENKVCKQIWKVNHSPSVRNIRVDDNGLVIWGTKRSGVFRYENGKVKSIYNTGKTYPGYVCDYMGTNYIFSDIVLYNYDSIDDYDTLTLNYNSEHDIHCCLVFDNQNLFVGNRIGLTQIKRNAFYNAKDQYPYLPNRIFSVYHAEGDTTYTGSVNGMVFKKEENRFESISNVGTPRSDVISLLAEDDKIWVGTSNSGLTYTYNSNTTLLSEKDSITSTIRFIKKAGANQVIAGGDETVHKFTVEENSGSILTKKYFKPQPKLSLYLKFNTYAKVKGTEFVASNEGLFKFNGSVLEKAVVEGFNNTHEIIQILPAESGIYIFTNDSGVFLINIIEDSLYLDKEFEQIRNIGPQHCLAAIGDSYQNIWVADYNGIWVLKSNKELLYFDHRDGYWDKLVNNIQLSVANDGMLWVTSSNGSLLLDIDKLIEGRKDFKFETININGQNYSRIEQNKFAEIVFDHKTTDLEIEVLLPQPIINHKIFQTYLLEPLDTVYSVLESKKLSIRNISDGEYILRIKSASQANLDLAEEVIIPIQIKQVFYKSTLAKLFYGVLIFSILYLIINYRARAKIRREKIDRQIELAEAKSTFFTQISHDFRTPLSIIKSANSRLMNAQKEKALIEKSSDDLLILIDQILDLNKMKAGNFELENIQSDIVKYINSLIAPFIDVAQSEHKKLMLESELESLTMDFDPIQLKRVIYNLISNALKFTMQEDSITINLSLIDDSFVISIKDTGQGIKSIHRDHIFDMYYSTRRHLSQSSGIGLAFVKQMLTTMRGDIKVESKEGEGSTFIMSLPITRKAKWQDSFKIFNHSMYLNINHEDRIPKVKDSETSILLVEDNLQLNEILSEWLYKRYNVISAANGQIGLELCQKYIPDVIISDIMMPIMNGFEMCKNIKADKQINHIPLIFLTAKVDHSSKMIAIELGAEGFIDKPFDENEIILRIEGLLANRKILQGKYRDSIHEVENTSRLDKSQLSYLKELNDLIQNNLDDSSWGVKELSKGLLTNHVSLNKKIKQLTGLTASAYIRKYKLRKANQLILESTMQLNEISDHIGISDPAYFSKLFKSEYNILPSELRKL